MKGWGGMYWAGSEKKNCSQPPNICYGFCYVLLHLWSGHMFHIGYTSFLSHRWSKNFHSFHHENGIGNIVPFLDVLVMRMGSALIIEVYRKPVSASCYLNCESSFTVHVKIKRCSNYTQQSYNFVPGPLIVNSFFCLIHPSWCPPTLLPQTGDRSSFWDFFNSWYTKSRN